MNRTSSWLAWGAVALVALLAVINWQTLMAPAPLNLLVMQIQAPLGVVLLGVAAVLAALFFVSSLRTHIGALLESRRLFREIQRVQELADKAEASRMENLHHLVITEFRLLNERLDSFGTRGPAGGAAESDAPFKPLSLTETATRRERH